MTEDIFEKIFKNCKRYSIKELYENYDIISKESGIYLVECPENFKAVFSDYPERELKIKKYFYAADLTDKYNRTLNNKILYIGKADIRKNGHALNERIEELIRYGYGEVPNHKGGKVIWQIQNNEQLLVCWETLDEINRKWNKAFDTAKSAERALIDYFYNKYNEYPLANMEERGKYKKHA